MRLVPVRHAGSCGLAALPATKGLVPPPYLARWAEPFGIARGVRVSAILRVDVAVVDLALSSKCILRRNRICEFELRKRPTQVGL